MLRDDNGLFYNARNRETLDRLGTAADRVHSFRGDPMAPLDEALADEPDFTLGWAVRGALLALTSDRRYNDEIGRCLDNAKAGWDRATDRERAHVAAVQAYLDGDLPEATARWGRIAQDHPRDVLALQFAHTGDFFLGQTAELRDRPLQALRAWDGQERGAGYIHGMAAFGWEENGEYDRALDAARRALVLNPGDAWAVHAEAHVHEMRGEVEEGVIFLTGRKADWATDNGLAYHNWWHLALLHLDRQDHAAVLRLYDEAIRPEPSDVALQLVDGSALLWRLHLAGVDVGDRFEAVAQDWSALACQGWYAFNEVHVALAYAGAGRTADLADLAHEARSRAETADAIGAVFRDVGAPAVEAIRAFADGRYAEAAETLHRVRSRAVRGGGSNAQRDVLSLTLLEAARRAGLDAMAEAVAAERLACKPASPFNRMLAGRLKPAVAQAA